MPKYDMKDKIRRMSIIVYMLQKKEYNIHQIRDKMNYIMDKEWSKSIIEKDIAQLRDDFDCPIERVGNKLRIIEPYSFVNQIQQWVEFYI